MECTLCGDSNFLHLCIDHIGGGAEHRRRGLGGSIHSWLKNNNYPPGFRVLCWNCNFRVIDRQKSDDKKNVKQREVRRKIKSDVMIHYSEGTPVCKECGETDLEVLTIDHVNGGGCQHRKSIGVKGGGSTFYRWLRKNNYPEGFQVLCFNCNCSKCRITPMSATVS
jgi:hypothetical protein